MGLDTACLFWYSPLSTLSSAQWFCHHTFHCEAALSLWLDKETCHSWKKFLASRTDSLLNQSLNLLHRCLAAFLGPVAFFPHSCMSFGIGACWDEHEGACKPIAQESVCHTRLHLCSLRTFFEAAFPVVMFQSEGMPILLGRRFWLVMHARSLGKTAEESLKAKWRKKTKFIYFF